jgi:RHS repeat-associated protein
VSGGTIQKKYSTGVWGVAESDTGVITRFRMAGREYDQATKLYYMRARYYDPALGRFLSEDPNGTSGGLNLYAYSSNDPVNTRDPTGLCPEDEKGGRGRGHGGDDPPMMMSVMVSMESRGGYGGGDCGEGDWSGGSRVMSGSFKSWDDVFFFIDWAFAVMDARGADYISSAMLEYSLATAGWPHWGGKVGAWDPQHPTPQLPLQGGGVHGTPGFWTMRYSGPITKWPREWKPGSTEWSTNLGVTVAAYYGQFWDAFSKTVMDAFGIVSPSGFGIFTANPGTACDCKIRTYVP